MSGKFFQVFHDFRTIALHLSIPIFIDPILGIELHQDLLFLIFRSYDIYIDPSSSHSKLLLE